MAFLLPTTILCLLGVTPYTKRVTGMRLMLAADPAEPQRPKQTATEGEDAGLVTSLKNARANLASRSSPGAGLGTADEQSDAAYADLINTSMEQRGISLSNNDVEELEKGGTMWEDKAKEEKNKLGVLGDVFSVLKAFSGGAHIVKDKFGQT